MEITKRAIAKVVSTYGAQALIRKDIFYKMLEDMAPEHTEALRFIKMIYTDEIGQILSEALQVPYKEKENYYRKIDDYLQDQCGFVEPVRIKFINIFRDVLGKRTVEVNKYKDYKPALRLLKQKFGPKVSDDVIQNFLEENRLFYRFSITSDDVKHDMETV